jgi:hypothetical protein
VTAIGQRVSAPAPAAPVPDTGLPGAPARLAAHQSRTLASAFVVVLLAVADRVQAKQGSPGRRIDLGRVQPQSAFSGGVGGVHGHAPGYRFETPGKCRVGTGAYLSQVHEV